MVNVIYIFYWKIQLNIDICWFPDQSVQCHIHSGRLQEGKQERVKSR